MRRSEVCCLVDPPLHTPLWRTHHGWQLVGDWSMLREQEAELGSGTGLLIPDSAFGGNNLSCPSSLEFSWEELSGSHFVISKIKNLERKRDIIIFLNYIHFPSGICIGCCVASFSISRRYCFTVWKLAQWQAHLILDVCSFRGKPSPSRWWSCWAALMTWWLQAQPLGGLQFFSLYPRCQGEINR